MAMPDAEAGHARAPDAETGAESPAAPAASAAPAPPSDAADAAPPVDDDFPPPPRDIASLLTVVLTTSPTPSAPATDLVAAVLASFRAHCPALLACPVIVVFDTYDRVGPHLRLKKGCVTAAEAAHYAAYKANVRALVEAVWGVEGGEGQETTTTTENGLAEYGSPCIADNAVPFTLTRAGRGGRLAFVEPAARLGFGLAVRTALRAAATPYVWVQQHDWTLAADVPLAAMLDAMRRSEGVAEGGREALAETEEDAAASLRAPVVPIRYICLPSVRMLRYAVSPHVVAFPVLRALTAAFKQDVPTASSASSTATVTPAPASSAGETETETAGHRLPLTPLFFWHDKTHLASRAHYLARVFPSRLALGRGDFIEDHVGQRARTEMKRDAAAWPARWACWLYYPDHGARLCLRHLQGRTWRGEAQEQALRDRYRARNRSAASTAAALAVASGEAAAAREAAAAAAWSAMDMPFEGGHDTQGCTTNP